MKTIALCPLSRTQNKVAVTVKNEKTAIEIFQEKRFCTSLTRENL